MKTIELEHFKIDRNQPLTVIAGPCQIEDLTHAMAIALEVKRICEDLNVQFIYKSSFDKANRSSITTKRGVGMEQGLEILKTVSNKVGVPTITDIHESPQAAIVAESVSMLQIPALLCRQTDLLLAAGATGAPAMSGRYNAGRVLPGTPLSSMMAFR